MPPINSEDENVSASSKIYETFCIFKPLSFKDYFHITIKLLLTKIFKILPALIFCLFGFQTMIYFLGSGTAWIEYKNHLKECDAYWWTPLVFMNDLIPFFEKDSFGCMRWTAIFAIEMKLFLPLPPIVFLYSHGKTL